MSRRSPLNGGDPRHPDEVGVVCRVCGVLAIFLLATVIAAGGRPAAAAGSAGNALEFDGLDDFVNVFHAPSLSLQTLTVEAWVRIEDDPDFILQPFISKGTDFGNYTLNVLGAQTAAVPGTGSYVHRVATGNFSCCSGTPLVAFGDWSHVAATYSAGTATLYVDGQLVGSITQDAGTIAPLENLEDLFFGRAIFISAPDQFLHGVLDEVRIWNVVRTSAEIAENFNQIITPSAPGLVGYWNFDENLDDQNVSDLSPLGNHGTLGANTGLASDDPVRIASTAPVTLSAASCAVEQVAFVADSGKGELSAVDLGSGGITPIATGLSSPNGVALNAAQTIAFVTQAASGELSMVDLLTGLVTQVASGFLSPLSVVLNEAETTAFVAEGVGRLNKVDLASGTVEAVVFGLGVPIGLALNSAETSAFVIETSTGNLSEVDLATGGVTLVASGLAGPRGLALNASQTVAFVTEASAGLISAVDLGSGAVTQVASGIDFPDRIALDAAETTLFVTSSPAFGIDKLLAVDIASGSATTAADFGVTALTGVALACEPQVLLTVKVPMRWCGVTGAPSVDVPGQVLESTVDDALLARHERATDQIYLPQTVMAFLSGATPLAPNFPILTDPDTTIGQPGDVFYTSEEPGEFTQLISDCRAAWEAADPTVTGITAVNIRRFVNTAGDPTGLLGLGGRALPSNTAAQQVAGRIMVIDPAFTLPCAEQDPTSCLNDAGVADDVLIGHELGHALTLPHGNGLDDNGDGVIDDDAENEFDLPKNLMTPSGLGNTTITVEQRAQVRSQALLHIPDREVDPVPRPLADSGNDPLGDGPGGLRFLDIGSFSLAVDRGGVRTLLSQELAGRFPENATGLAYYFSVDLDAVPATGGSPADVGVPSAFTGAELVGRVDVDIVGGVAAATPTVFRFEGGAFVPVAHSGIRARVLRVLVGRIDLDPPLPGQSTEDEIGEQVQLELPREVRGRMGGEVRLEVIAQAPGVGLDIATARLTFRLPALPSCEVNPTSVDPPAAVTVRAQGLPPFSPVEVLLGGVSIALGSTDGDGGVALAFDVPEGGSDARRAVRVRAVGGAITAECDVRIQRPPAEIAAVCPRGQGFWKNHAEDWPVTRLILGDESYSRAELLALLGEPRGGAKKSGPPRRGADASLILARQLIAARLNFEAGSDPNPVGSAIASAESLLAGFDGKLPYGVRPSSSDGRSMVALAEALDDYNSGSLTPDCGPRRGAGRKFRRILPR